MASSPPRKRLRGIITAPGTPDTRDNATDSVPQDQADVHGHVVVSSQALAQGQSGRGSGEPADGNVSSKQKCSKPASLSSLSKIIVGELSLHRLAKLRRVLAQRYSGVNIYVDSMNTTPTIFVIQTRQWFKNHVLEYSVDWIGSLEIITSTMNKKWPSPVPSDKDEKFLCLHYMWRVFQFIAENIIYDRKKSQWISDEEAMPGSSTATAVNEERHQSHLPENKEDSLEDEPENLQEEGSSSGQGSGGNADDQDSEKEVTLLRATFCKYHILNYNIPERLASALESQMRNSCGRDAIRVLLQSACAIAFGPDYEKSGVFVYQVGTSNYPFEGFPVSSMDERTCDSPGNGDGPVPNVTEPLALELDPGSPPNVSHGDSKTNKSSSAESTRSFGKGYIYSDLIVACESGDSAKFLMVVEIKSSSCLQDEAQVLRQAVSALVGQKQVYGLVVSHLRGTLIKVYRDDEGSVIYFNRKRYDLLRPLRASPAFNNEHWFEMFMDIIKVLDTARENIILG